MGLLVNTLAAVEKYPVLNRDNLTIPIQRQLSQQYKTFTQFLSSFSKSPLNFEYFEKKDDPQSFCIFAITDSENVVRQMCKRCHFTRPFDKQHGKRAQALLKYASQHLYHIHWSLRSQLSWEKSLLLTCRTLGLLVKKLAADDKYPVLNRDNLTIPIQMQLSKKQESFSQFFAAFLKSKINFEYFETKVDPQSFCISEITHSENRVR